MRRGSSTSKEQSTAGYGQRDLRVTPERRKKLEQQVMENEGVRETRSRRSTAGKKPIRLMDAGVLHTKRQRKASSTNSVPSVAKDITMTTDDVQETEKPKEVVRMRRLGVLRTIDSPVKKKGLTRGRPPKMIHRQIEPIQDHSNATENSSTADDVFDSAEQMSSTEAMAGSGDGTEVAVERETTGSDTADMLAPRDINRKEITEHKPPRDIREASAHIAGGSGGTSTDANSGDEAQAAQPVENGLDEASSMDDSHPVLHDNANESRQDPAGAPSVTPMEDVEDDITPTMEAAIQGHPAAALAIDLGDSVSTHREGSSMDGLAAFMESQGTYGEGNSDSDASDRWEAQQRGGKFDSLSDDGSLGSDMMMKNMQETGSGDGKVKERRRRPMEGSDKRTCDICMETFPTARELTQHIRKHNSVNSHNCKVCAKTLSSASSLDRHMLIHSGERPFKCTLCPMAFTTNGNMHRHMRTHEKEGVDLDEYVLRGDYTRPRKRVPSKRLLDSAEDYSMSPPKKLTLDESRVVYSPVEDMKVNEGEVLDCPVCGKSFICKYGLQSHMDLHPNLALRCSMCDSLFRNHRGLRMHIHMAHERRKDTGKEDEQIPLGFQDLSFMEFSTNKFPLVAQVWCEQNVRRCNSVEHRFICRDCNKAFPCSSALDLHVSNAHSDRTEKNFSGSPSSDKENQVNSAMEHFAVIDKLDDAAKEECQKEFMAALQLKPVPQAKKVTPAVVPATPGLLMVPSGPLDRGLVVRQFDYNHTMKMDNMANPLLATKARVMDFADVQQILKMTSASGNPLSLLHQPGQSKRSPLKGATPDAMDMPSEAVPSGEMPGDLQAAKLPPILLPAPRQDTRSEPLSGDVATGEMHVPMEDASRHRLMMSMSSPGQLMSSPGQSDITNGLEDDSSSQPGSESDSESLNGLKKFNGKHHTCRYCEKTFPFASTLKVHMRSHLGLTPYKCMLCSYSSADKSTLVRHMRTHSGERPYSCKLCKFPFTTKANCERHIKKRHNKFQKADIELCIETNQLSNTSLDGKFCSPDTVCKICNRDFKFFRDLQNHLRVHERTPTKPFVCQRCQMGFTSRGNCARHIIKSHPEVGENNIEKSIIVHEVTFSDTQSINTDDSTYLDDLINLDSPQSEPLDFSMKGSSSRIGSNCTSPLPSISPLVLFNTDGPIDLSIPKPGSTVGKLRFKRVYHKFYSRLIDGLVCPHCSQAFAHGSLFKQHIRSHTMERPYRCYFCAAAFTMKENLDKHIEKRHSVSTTTDRPAQAFIPKIATPMQFKLNVARTSQAAHQKSPFEQSDEGPGTPTPPPQGELSVVTDLVTSSLPQNALQAPVIVNNNYNSTDSSVELSSISRILANTSSSNFQNFLTPPLMTANGSPLLMTALSTNPVSVNSQAAPREVRNVPVIMKNRDQETDDPDVVFIKQEPQSSSDIASPFPQPIQLAQQLQPPQLSETFHPSQSVQMPYPILNPDTHSQAFRNDVGQDLSNDMDQVDEPIPLEKTPAGKELLRKQTCPYCFRKFPWISSLKRHILTHTGLKPYQCPQCGSSFSTKSNCERHIVRRHCGGSRESSHDNSPTGTPSDVPLLEELFICLECKEVAFSSRRKLEKHYETHHPTYPFPECYIEPQQVMDLSTSEPQQVVDLSTSSKKASSSALDLSVKSPTSFSSPIGGRVSLPSYHHHQHHHQHHHHHHHQQSSVIKEGKRLLKKAAAVKMKKRSHEYGQIHEDDVYSADPNREYAASSASTYNNLVMKFSMKPSQHSCHMCSKRFKSSTALKRHHRVHTLEHPFQCVKCQACFTTKFNCQRHMQKLHGMSKEDVALIKEVEFPNRSHDLPTMVALPELGKPAVSSIDTPGNVNTDVNPSRDVTAANPTSSCDSGDVEKTNETGMGGIGTELNEDSNLSSNLSESYPTLVPRESALMISEPDSSSNSELSVLKKTSQEEEDQLRIAAAQVAANTNRQPNSPSSSARKDTCISPDNDDEDDNEDIKKFKELDPDITIVNPKTPSEEGDDAKNMTWTLDSNVTASPEGSSYVEDSQQMMMRQSAAENTNEAFSTPGDDEIMPSGMGNSDIIQNLLGIQDSSVIDQMLDTPDSQTAAKLLGV
ncbi:uncharacterized protein [Amphiura filiformis]